MRIFVSTLYTVIFSFCYNTTITAQGNSFSKINKNFKIVTGSFSGKIIDAKTGAAIEAASIYITDIKSGTTSDVSGYFSIKNIPTGKHLVEISHIGYTSIIENIDFANEIIINFALSEAIIENNAVIVTGVTGATQLKKVPFAIEVMRKQDFFQNTSSNIIESLTKISGVATLATGPAISKPVIRGLSYNRVLTINDGVRQEGQQWGDEHGIEIDEASVAKIELFKGPASIIYGSDAMAGVVNIITNMPISTNSLKANISSNYQTNNNLRTLNVNLAGNQNGFNWNIYTSNKAAEDYKNRYDGKVFNSKFNEHNYGGYGGFNGDWGYSHVLFSSFNLKAGLVEGKRDAEGYFTKKIAGGITERANNADFKNTTPLDPYQHIRHRKIAIDNNIKMGKNYITLNIAYQQNKREEFANPDAPAERALFFDLKTITYNAQIRLSEIQGWKTSVGINGMQQNNSNKGLEQLIPDYSLFDFGLYAYSQKTIKKITLSGGFRYDTRKVDAENLLDGFTIKGTQFKKTFSNFSGSLGIAAQLTENLNLKFNIARGFRAPSITEIASNGAHEGTTRYEYGNTTLKNETSIQLDAGIAYRAEHISVGLSAFYNNFDNFIFSRKLEAMAGGDSLVNVSGDLLTAFKFDQQIVSLTGIETSLDIHPHPLDWLHILNTFSMVVGKLKKNIEGVRFIPFIPSAKLVTEFKVTFKKVTNNVSNFYTKFEIENTFAKNNVFTAYNTETKTAGYSLLNAGIGADFVSKNNKTLFSLSASAINITDIAYQNHLSRLKYAEENLATGRLGIFNMGRNFSIKVNIPLSFNLAK